VVKIDVKDRNMDTNRNCNLFAGHIDWEAVRQSLAEIGFTGWATAEVDGGDARQLKQVAQQMDRALGI
jgi:L-ribulose-5-phosphate 3-epimerase